MSTEEHEDDLPFHAPLSAALGASSASITPPPDAGSAISDSQGLSTTPPKTPTTSPSTLDPALPPTPHSSAPAPPPRSPTMSNVNMNAGAPPAPPPRAPPKGRVVAGRAMPRVPTMLHRNVRMRRVTLPPPPRHALTLSSWTLLLADLGLIGATGLLLEDASRIFDCAQMPEDDAVVDVERTFDDALRSDPDSELTFPEFQEALIAVAVCVARDPSLPLHARIRAVFELALPAVQAT